MAEAQWYMAIGGQQVGPVSEQDVVNAIRSGSADVATLVFTSGMDNWTPLGQVDKFKAHVKASAPPPIAAPPPPRAGGARTRSTSRSRARTCSSSRSSSTRARARWPRPARSCT